MAAIDHWLTARGYKNLPAGEGTKYDHMKPGTSSYRLNVPADQDGTEKIVSIPVDVVVMSKASKVGDLPLLIEAKSAGNLTNVNKRQKRRGRKTRDITGIRSLYSTLSSASYVGSLSPPMKVSFPPRPAS